MRGLQSGCIDLAHAQNEIRTVTQHSSAGWGRAVAGQCKAALLKLSQRKNTSRQAWFGKKDECFILRSISCFVCFFFKTPSVMFSLQLSSVQNSPEI